ncbi:hypothetical protein EFN56_09630, partial [Leuconostoc citreum]|nr:hypothetical protein [Leuconostoc citreum]
SARNNFWQQNSVEKGLIDLYQSKITVKPRVISIMNAEDFESKYQEDDGVGRKLINNEISSNITLDTTKAQRALDLLGKTVEQIKGGEHTVKQPHIRIEFDDIRDAPKVWIDGKRDYDYNNNHAVIILEKHY